MSLYNVLFGKNPLSGVILGMLELTESDCGRYRDCFITEGKIAIYTRLGGGNRECFCDAQQVAEGHSSCFRRYIEKLQAHPNYLSDKDDDFDSTYATFYFSFPDTSDAELLGMLNEKGELGTDERWTKKLEEIKSLSADELKEKYPQMVEVVEKIAKAVEEGGGIVEV